MEMLSSFYCLNETEITVLNSAIIAVGQNESDNSLAVIYLVNQQEPILLKEDYEMVKSTLEKYYENLEESNE